MTFHCRKLNTNVAGFPSLFAAILTVFIVTASAAFGAPDNSLVAVAGSPTVESAVRVSSATPDPGLKLHLTFALRSSRVSQIGAFIASQQDKSSANYHKYLTPEEFGERFGASDADVNAVANYAAAEGFTVTNIWPNKLFVSADATVAQAEAAFGFHEQGFARPAAQVAQGEPDTYYAPDGAPVLPVDIANRVTAVYGFDDMLQMHPRSNAVPISPNAVPTPVLGTGLAASTQTSPAAFGGPMQPADVSTFYELDPLHAKGFYGDGQSIGLYSPTLYDPNDVSDFTSAYGISGYTITVRNIDGGAVNYSAQLEATTDIEVTLSQAPHVHIYLYEGPNNVEDNLDFYNQMASDNIPVISHSYGIAETALQADGLASLASSWDTVFQEMYSQGQAFYASSGDTGAVVVEPSSDPYITAVGGTDYLVDNSNGTYDTEQGWTGSGGGNSIFWNTPGYQSGPGVSNGYSNGSRQVPDIAADGGPNPGYLLHATGGSGSGWYHVWGTSCSSPLWATANVLMNQGTQSLGYGNRSFNLNAFLYDIGNNLNSYQSSLPGAFVFHDVTVGNSGFPCTAGWDYVTGWGSARFWKLYADDVLPANPTGNYPGGWPAPIIVSTSSTAASQPASFNNQTTYYIGGSYQCAGPADLVASTLDVQLDGADHNANYGPLPVGYAWTDFPAITTTLALGPHTLKLLLNGTSLYSETVTSRPSNDDFANAQSISGASGSVTGTNEYATKQSGEPNHGGNAGGASVWYAWTAPANGDYTFATFDSSFDTLLGIYTGSSVSSLKAVAENDDFGGTVQSEASFTAKSGVTYYIAVDGYDGATGSIDLEWAPVTLSAIDFATNPLPANTTGSGTVYLYEAGANPSGSTISLSSSNASIAKVPATVIVPVGATSANFSITTGNVAASSVTITATYNGGSVSKVLTVTPAPYQITGVTFNPAAVIGGSPSTGTVTVSKAAPSGGDVIKLVSGNTALATVGSTVTIASGATSAKFTVTTHSVTAVSTVSISASATGIASKSGTLNLDPAFAILTQFALEPTPVFGGAIIMGEVSIAGSAPAGGEVVTLSSTVPSVVPVPSEITIPAGQTSLTFPITTGVPSSDTTATVTASTNVSSMKANATVKATYTISGKVVNAATSAALSGVAVTASNTGLWSQDTVLTPGLAIPPDKTSGAISVYNEAQVGNVTAVSVIVNITSTNIGNLVVKLISPNGTKYTLHDHSGSGSTSLYADYPVLTVPDDSTNLSALVGTPINGKWMLFVEDTGASGTDTGTLVSWELVLSYSGINAIAGKTNSSGAYTLSGVDPGSYLVSATLTPDVFAPASQTVTVGPSATGVNFSGTFPDVSSLSLSPTSVVGGAPSTGTVTLNVAPTAVVVVSLSSSNTAAATVPSSVKVLTGSKSATFTISTSSNASTLQPSISASFGGTTKSATLTLVGASAVSALTVSPTSVTGGVTSTGTVTLAAAAPAGGEIVALSSSATSAATVPATVTVAAGAKSAAFTVSTSAVSTTTDATLTATAGGASAKATLQVKS